MLCQFINTAAVYQGLAGECRKYGNYQIEITGVCIVLAAGSEIQANLQFNIFSFPPFVAFSGGAPWVQIWLPPQKWG